MLLAITLFVTSFVAATIIPFSSEVALYGALEAGMEPRAALLSASTGNVLAVVCNYYLGYFLYTKTKNKLLASKVGKKAFRLGHRYGYFALLLSALPVIGDPITLVAGMARLSFFWFLLIAGSLRVARYVAIIYMVE
jgi:membrane protein YqaA with SNARE-associated domain